MCWGKEQVLAQELGNTRLPARSASPQPPPDAAGGEGASEAAVVNVDAEMAGERAEQADTNMGEGQVATDGEVPITSPSAKINTLN